MNDPELGLVVLDVNTMGTVYCGAKVGQFGKVCYEQCTIGKNGCGGK